jgi:hypothetical protein
MKNFICTYEEIDGNRDEFRVVAASLSDAEEKAMEQIAEDLGYEAPAEQLRSFQICTAAK